MGRNKTIILAFFVIMMTGAPVLRAAGDPDLPVFPEKRELLDLIADEKAAPEIMFDTDWGSRNPFDAATLKVLMAPAPAVAAVAAMPKALEDPNVVLSGIVWSSSRPSAIINDEVVGVGGKVLSMTVKEIKEGLVILTDGQNEMLLSPQK